jgi:1-pyrroline-5-carboxylate dehydrogenase
LNFCPRYGGEIGDHLVTDARTRFISFTGSVETGLRINELAARQIPEQRWIKGILVETGGKDAMIIDDSADLDAAADDIVKREPTATRDRSAVPPPEPSCTGFSAGLYAGR